jgi:hypothetical protein
MAKKKILPGQAALICNCPNARLNGEWVTCEEYNSMGEWTVKGNKFPLSVGMSISEEYLEVESSASQAPNIVPEQSAITSKYPTEMNQPVETSADNQQSFRSIKIHFASGEAVEVVAGAGDTVSSLCRRIADLCDAGWATLLVGSETLDENLDACSIPETIAITAVLSNPMDRPDRLKKTLREQIQKSCEINLHGDEDLEEAFKQTDWKLFRQYCQPVQDFHITLFECAGKKIIDINYGLGDNDYGTFHREDVIDPIFVYRDGDCEPKVEAWTSVHNAYCNQCNKTIIGTRYKSLELNDYDPCEACFNSEDRKADALEQPDTSLDEEDDDEEDDEDEDADEEDEERVVLRAIFALEPCLKEIFRASRSQTHCIETHGA